VLRNVIGCAADAKRNVEFEIADVVTSRVMWGGSPPWNLWCNSRPRSIVGGRISNGRSANMTM
jgi:hypothetical protein